MTFQGFISKLNWRQIFIHFIAFCFFIYAFQTLAYLNNPKLLLVVRQSEGINLANNLKSNGLSDADVSYFLLWTIFSGLIGLIIAFIVSLIISMRRRWFWINTLFTFLFTYFFYRFNLLGWDYLKYPFWYLGQRFNNVFIEFALNGAILLSIGLVFFFLKRINKFIESKAVRV